MRLINILYRLSRLAAFLAAVVGYWYAYWAPDNKLIVFALFAGPGLLCWMVGKFVRFVAMRFCRTG